MYSPFFIIGCLFALSVQGQQQSFISGFPLNSQYKVKESSNANPEVDYAQWVNNFAGTEGGGNVFPGATLPYGAVKVGIDTLSTSSALSGWTPNGKVSAVSLMHLSGTGGTPKYGVVSQLPLVGDISSLNLGDNSTYSQERISKDLASPGLFQTFLPKVEVSMTATQHTGFIRYSKTSDKNDEQLHILVDASHFLPAFSGEVKFTQKYEGSRIEVKEDGSYIGNGSFSGGWNRSPKWTIYFCGKFSETPSHSSTFITSRPHSAQAPELQPSEEMPTQTGGSDQGVGALFSWNETDVLTSRIGVSWISTDKACSFLDNELPQDSDFDQVSTHARKTWNGEVLSKMQLPEQDGISEDHRSLLYTSLYNHAVLPSNRTGENPDWESDEPYYDDFYTIWDTFRSGYSLMNLLYAERYVEILRSLIDTWRHDGFYPDGRSSNYNGRTQGGSNADNLFGDAYVKGLSTEPSINWQNAFSGMLTDAEVVPPNTNDSDSPESSTKEGRGALPDWLQYSYITPNFTRAVSRSVEYSVNDYSLALVSKGLGNETASQKYLKRSENWKNQWNDEYESLGFKGFVGPRNADGSYVPQHKLAGPVESFSGYWGDPAYEATLWEYSFGFPHDVAGLIEKMGGRDQFVKRLDTSMERSLLGIGNEPSFLTPYLYNYAGKSQWKTVDAIQSILSNNYTSGSSAYPGNTDAGALPAYLLFGYMGLYPVVPSPIYLVASPTFSSLNVQLQTSTKSQSGSVLSILKTGSTSGKYVQSFSLNGLKLNRSWIHHNEIKNGGKLEFEMGDEQVEWDDGELPPSSSTSKDGLSFEI